MLTWVSYLYRQRRGNTPTRHQMHPNVTSAFSGIPHLAIHCQPAYIRTWAFWQRQALYQWRQDIGFSDDKEERGIVWMAGGERFCEPKDLAGAEGWTLSLEFPWRENLSLWGNQTSDSEQAEESQSSESLPFPDFWWAKRLFRTGFMAYPLFCQWL